MGGITSSLLSVDAAVSDCLPTEAARPSGVGRVPACTVGLMFPLWLKARILEG